MKKAIRLTFLTVLILALGGAALVQAEILPPHGEGQIGLPAVVLCEELTLRENPSSSSKALRTLRYKDLPIVINQSGNWAYCALGDAEDSPVGWINADYLAIDPAWYRTNGSTPVYAWNSTEAPKVALLKKNATLPILKENGSWLLVSLRGAAGWIRKTAGD